MKKHPSGFTLVEMLVVIAIIAILGTIAFAGVCTARQKAKSVVEVGAARNLIAGYLSYAAENNGRLLPGKKDTPGTTNLEGSPLGNTINARYPWRLAPYVPSIKGAILFNGNEKILEAADATMRDYMASVSPNLGLNTNFVGGHYGSGSLLDADSDRLVGVYGKFFVSNLSEAVDPSKLIVFASASREINAVGSFQVQGPNADKKIWSSAKYDPEAPPSNHGFVDFRWNNKAVTAMLAGNVELHSENELRDMRYWSNQAAQANNPDYVVTSSR